jgi:hypothetical protein
MKARHAEFLARGGEEAAVSTLARVSPNSKFPMHLQSSEVVYISGNKEHDITKELQHARKDRQGSTSSDE